MTEIDIAKKVLREKHLLLRSEINPKTKREFDRSICDSIKEIISEIKPSVVHAYLPIKGEINITPVLEWCLEKNIKIICPKVLPKRQLANLELKSMADLEMGPFDTIHPAGNLVYNGKIDLILMPGLAFDKDLNRLGYGGGYYDRFLVNHRNALKVALLYPFQLVDKVPVDSYDVKVDRLIVAIA